MGESTGNYGQLLSKERPRTSTSSNRSLSEEATSDYGRILYSAAFRRLQKKAQVFPLEDNAAVRSRLTHSLEVAHLGHEIALGVIRKLSLEPDQAQAFPLFVETACLCHDIGNPPFGHFGETAICNWFDRNEDEILSRISINNRRRFQSRFFADFRNFDGNPQGLRIALRLQRNTDEFGLNLTHTQTLANTKYTASSSEVVPGRKLSSKAGFFETERFRVKQARSALKMDDNARHPLAYIMEAADDSAYCLSDIEDALEKRIVRPSDLEDYLSDDWPKNENSEKLSDHLAYIKDLAGIATRGFLEFKVTVSNACTRAATKAYLKNHDAILAGTAQPLLDDEPQIRAILKFLKEFCRARIYRAPEAEHLELAGYSCVSGILDAFLCLLRCSRKDFEGQSDARIRRLRNLLPEGYIASYRETLSELTAAHADILQDDLEIFARAHLVVDYVAGMTDHFALVMHRTLSGEPHGYR